MATALFIFVLSLAITASTADLAPTGSPVGSPLGASVESPVGSLFGAPVGAPVGSPIGSPVGSSDGSPVGSPNGSPVESPVGSPVGSPIGSPVGSPAEAPVWSSIGSPVEAPDNTPSRANAYAARHHQAQSAATDGAVDLISETCNLARTPHVDLCVESLSSEPPSRRATREQLASIMLRLASRNATENAGYIIGLADQAEAEPKLEQCLTDCIEQYQDAIEQVKDAMIAIDDGGYQDAITWIQAGMADVKTCQEGCKEVAEHKNVLTKRNGDFNRLCSIAISIIRSLK